MPLAQYENIKANLDGCNHNIQRIESAVFELTAQVRELRAIVEIQQQQNERRLAAQEKLGPKLLFALGALAAGGGIAGQAIARIFGG